MERKPIWICTLATQVCLFFALYIALNLGHPQTSIYRAKNSNEFYFISVSGGFRPLLQQTLLLKTVSFLSFSIAYAFSFCFCFGFCLWVCVIWSGFGKSFDLFQVSIEYRLCKAFNLKGYLFDCNWRVRLL